MERINRHSTEVRGGERVSTSKGMTVASQRELTKSLGIGIDMVELNLINLGCEEIGLICSFKRVSLVRDSRRVTAILGLNSLRP
jgi:hypothetical protein